jgi:steroid 5-alpha reductase family enzyme
VISAPLVPAIIAPGGLGPLELAGVALAAFGIAYETIADRQLARFLAEPGNGGRVMDRGLWRYSRHPNYFGECCVWWGLYAVAVGAGGAWTVFSPILMTVLLLRVSGVTLLEKDIGERRPTYGAYARRTNAFLPGPPRTA